MKYFLLSPDVQILNLGVFSQLRLPTLQLVQPILFFVILFPHKRSREQCLGSPEELIFGQNVSRGRPPRFFSIHFLRQYIGHIDGILLWHSRIFYVFLTRINPSGHVKFNNSSIKFNSVQFDQIWTKISRLPGFVITPCSLYARVYLRLTF